MNSPVVKSDIVHVTWPNAFQSRNRYIQNNPIARASQDRAMISKKFLNAISAPRAPRKITTTSQPMDPLKVLRRRREPKNKVANKLIANQPADRYKAQLSIQLPQVTKWTRKSRPRGIDTSQIIAEINKLISKRIRSRRWCMDLKDIKALKAARGAMKNAPTPPKNRLSSDRFNQLYAVFSGPPDL